MLTNIISKNLRFGNMFYNLSLHDIILSLL